MRELAIDLNPDTKEPLYEQIYSYIRSEIRKGQLLPGERLPSTRFLSAFLEVSRSTVDLAYGQLVSEGYLEAVPWKGYYVCRIEGLYSLSPERGPVRERRAAESSLWDYDLTPNGIDLEHFPYEAVSLKGCLPEELTEKLTEDSKMTFFIKTASIAEKNSA